MFSKETLECRHIVNILAFKFSFQVFSIWYFCLTRYYSEKSYYTKKSQSYDDMTQALKKQIENL